MRTICSKIPERATQLCCFSAAAVYFSGGMMLTMLVNVPMNDALAVATAPEDPADAARIWQGYSAPWQNWNAIRTVTSGTGLALVGAALLNLPPSNALNASRLTSNAGPINLTNNVADRIDQ